MFRKTMLLIFNPKAGTKKFSTSLFDVINKFTAAGFLVTAYPTQAPGDVNRVILELAENYDYVVCSGGDGTIGEAIDALLSFEKRPFLGIIPSGTVNDFAMSLGIPKNILEAADIIVSGTPRPIDIGQFGDKHFTYVSAFGLFTDVSYATPQSRKNKLGNIAYLLEGAKRLGAIQPYHCTFTIDDEEISGDFVLGIVANSQSVGGMKLPEDIGAQMNDGMFEVVLLRMPKNIITLNKIINSLLNQETISDSMIVRKAHKVTVTSAEPIAWTRDGEYGGECCTVVIENKCHAIEILNQ